MALVGTREEVSARAPVLAMQQQPRSWLTYQHEVRNRSS